MMLAYMIAFVGLALVTAIHIHMRNMEDEEKISHQSADWIRDDRRRS